VPIGRASIAASKVIIPPPPWGRATQPCLFSEPRPSLPATN
jgi:hypothetical protein